MVVDVLDTAQIPDGLRQIDTIITQKKSRIGEHYVEPCNAPTIVILRTIPRAQVTRTREELLNRVVMTGKQSGQHVYS